MRPRLALWALALLIDCLTVVSGHLGLLAAASVELEEYGSTSLSTSSGKPDFIKLLEMNSANKTRPPKGSSEKNETSSESVEAKVKCAPRNLSDDEDPGVKLVNSSVLLDLLTVETNSSQHECYLVLFYFPWCSFSLKAAPHYNALARVYPQLHFLAVDAYTHNRSVPTSLLI